MRKIFLILFIQGYIMASTIFKLDIDGVKIPVIFVKDDRLPLRNLELVFKDSGFLSSNRAGLASISSKVLDEGSLKDGAIKFSEELDKHAISLNTNIGRETFVISLEGLDSEFNFGIEKLKELLTSPNYTEETLKKVITQRVGKLMRKKSDFDYIASTNLRETLFKGSPLANPELGTIESVKSITLDEVKNFLNSRLHLDNLIVLAGGNFSETELRDLLNKLLKTLKRGEVKPIPYIKVSDKSSTKTIFKDTKQAYIYFGAPYFMEVNSTKRVYGKIASFILGSSGFGSRMMEEIRVKRGLAYSAYSRFIVNKTHSYFSGYLQTKLESADEAKKVVKELVKNFIQNGVTQEELESAKKFFLGSEPLRNETLSQKINRDFRNFYDGLGIGYYKKELELIESMKLEDLNNFIKSHNEIESMSFSIVTKSVNLDRDRETAKK